METEDLNFWSVAIYALVGAVAGMGVLFGLRAFVHLAMSLPKWFADNRDQDDE